MVVLARRFESSAACLPLPVACFAFVAASSAATLCLGV